MGIWVFMIAFWGVGGPTTLLTPGQTEGSGSLKVGAGVASLQREHAAFTRNNSSLRELTWEGVAEVEKVTHWQPWQGTSNGHVCFLRECGSLHCTLRPRGLKSMLQDPVLGTQADPVTCCSSFPFLPVHVCLHVCLCTCMCVRVHVSVYLCVYRYDACVRVCIHVSLCLHVHAVRVCVYACMMRVCACPCVHVCVCVALGLGKCKT